VQTRIARGKQDMARPSVMMRIGTPDFLSKFTFYFEEHVEGFTGLRGSKRERTEQEKNMEWRKRLEAKKKVKKTSKQGKCVDLQSMIIIRVGFYQILSRRYRAGATGSNTAIQAT